MGVAGLPTAPPKAPVWQLLHWLTTVTLAWNCPGLKLEKPALWHASQLALAAALMSWYGTWLLGLATIAA
jgi:hypothetical protein